MCRSFNVMAAFVVASIACLSMVSSIQADIIDDFETGYTDDTCINGTNGWVTGTNTGLYADATGGKGGGWGAYPGGSTYPSGSSRAHGIDIDNAYGITFDLDFIQTGANDAYNHSFVLYNPDPNNYQYLSWGFNMDDNTWALSHKTGSTVTLIEKVTDLPAMSYNEWYHVKLEWTMDGAMYATLSDSSGNVIDVIGSDTAGSGLSSFDGNLTMLKIQGRAVSGFDNVELREVIVPEPSTLALLAAGLIGLLAYAWRKRK